MPGNVRSHAGTFVFFQVLWLVGAVLVWFCSRGGRKLSLAIHKQLCSFKYLLVQMQSVQPASVLCPTSPPFCGGDEVGQHFSWSFMD